MASQLVPLLHCPVCSPPAPLIAPVTLFCGHSVCARHVQVSPTSPSSPRLLRLSPCPLSSCTVSPSNPASLPNVPSSSRVTFYPAPGFLLDRDTAAFATIPASRTDVTINKLTAVVHRYDQHTQPITLDSSSGSDSETDDEEILHTNTTHPSPSQPGVSTSGSTSIVPSDPSSSSSISTQIASSLDASLQQQAPARSNARKRRRKHLPPPRRLTSPAQSTDQDQFENELLAELSCEICFMLLYQPITSSCQHVRALLSRCSRICPPPSTQSPLHLSDLLFKMSIPFLRPWPSVSSLSPGLAWGHVFPRPSVQQDSHLDPYVPTPVHVCSLILFILPSRLVLKAFPEAYAERGRLIEQEERHARLDTPIFVCQLSFPGLPTVLHFFEPRHLLSRSLGFR